MKEDWLGREDDGRGAGEEAGQGLARGVPPQGAALTAHGLGGLVPEVQRPEGVNNHEHFPAPQRRGSNFERGNELEGGGARHDPDTRQGLGNRLPERRRIVGEPAALA